MNSKDLKSIKVIAFCGPKGCGKDTAASFLLDMNAAYGKNLFRKAPMAEGVKNICRDFFGWLPEEMDDFTFKETPRPLWEGGLAIEPRWPMMDVANWLRDKYGGDIHARRWAQHTRNNAHWGAHVVTDMRFPEELEVLSQFDFFPIYIDRPAAEEALGAKQRAGDSMANNPSETHYAFLRQYAEAHGAVISNDGPTYKLQNNVLMRTGTRFEHWHYWLPEVYA